MRISHRTIRTTGQNGRLRRRDNRRGISLVIVMLAISMSLVLTYSFLRTQATSQLISQNGTRSDLALQAAQTGAAVAVAHVQTLEWEGVEETLTRVVLKDDLGVASYFVEFLPWEQSSKYVLPNDAPLHLIVRSTGTWTSAENSYQQIERRVEVLLRLNPRLPGRALRKGDDATVTDIAENPDDYDQIQQYSLFAQKGSSTLVLDPRDRIDGPIWLYDNLVLFGDPRWNKQIREQTLEEIGQQFVTYIDGRAVFMHPHPLAGEITFKKKPSGPVRDDLEALGVPWTQVSDTPDLPKLSRSDWSTYRLYEKGFEYKPVEVDSKLSNTTLRPSLENPLGIFYRDGSVRIGDNVVIQGTLVVDGTVSIEGEPVQITSFNWRGPGGVPIISDQNLLPRLPSLVARDVTFSRDTRAVIEGAIIADSTLTGAGGAFEYSSSDMRELTGSATAQSVQQPWSVVQLKSDTDLASLEKYGDYSVWIPAGTTGNWYEITDIDAENHRVTIVGEVNQSSGVDVRIRANRANYVDIRGPVAVDTSNINRPDPWGDVSDDQWDDLFDDWLDAIEAWVEAKLAAAEEDENEKEGMTEGRDKDDESESNDAGESSEEIPHPGSFIDWIANVTHFNNFSEHYQRYGLTFEPTFHLRNTQDIQYRWSPPLFRAYEGIDDKDEFAGYRWTVISWREVHQHNE